MGPPPCPVAWSYQPLPRTVTLWSLAVLRPGADQLLSLMTEELYQVHFTGLELLLLGKMDIGHLLTSLTEKLRAP